MAEMADGQAGSLHCSFTLLLLENGKQYVRFDSLLSAAFILSSVFRVLLLSIHLQQPVNLLLEQANTRRQAFLFFQHLEICRLCTIGTQSSAQLPCEKQFLQSLAFCPPALLKNEQPVNFLQNDKSPLRRFCLQRAFKIPEMEK